MADLRGVDFIGKTVVPGTKLFSTDTDYLIPGTGVYLIDSIVFSAMLGTVKLEGKSLSVVPHFSENNIRKPKIMEGDIVIGRVIKITPSQVFIELITDGGGSENIAVINSEKISEAPLMLPGDAFCANDLVRAVVVGFGHQILLSTVPSECGVIYTTCPQGKL